MVRRRRPSWPPVRALRSPCPIAGALDILGDTWTLLLIRDLLFYDKHRFADFLDSPERISTNILSERLRRLERCGLVERRMYQERPRREEYYLAARGHDLLPVLRELIKWGKANVLGTARRPPPTFAGVAPRPPR
ncbi:MAG: winged helix-turn-helix transcriptional regulator [Vicinamibacteria bacterium]